MDFHTLSRRDLQALCKRNKIPANITNVAMADSLKALEFVEGIEEFVQSCDSETAQSSIESPVRSEVTSPYVPPTGGRSTRRRNVAKEPETAKPSARAPHTARRTVAKNAEETPAVVPQSNTRKGAIASAYRKMDSELKECMEEEKKDVLVTPAPSNLASRRRRGAKEESVVKPPVYSTRRSVRLAKKNVELLDENTDLSKKDLFNGCQDFNMNLKEGSDDSDEMSIVTGTVDADNTVEEKSENMDEAEVVSAEKQDIIPVNDSGYVPKIEKETEEVGGPEVEEQVEKEKTDNMDEAEVVSAENEDVIPVNETSYVPIIEKKTEEVGGSVVEAQVEKEKSIETLKDEKVQDHEGSLEVQASEMEMEVEKIEQQNEDNSVIYEVASDIDTHNEKDLSNVHEYSEDVKMNEEKLEMKADVQKDSGEKELNADESDSWGAEMPIDISLMSEEDETSKWDAVFAAYVNEKPDSVEEEKDETTTTIVKSSESRDDDAAVMEHVQENPRIIHSTPSKKKQINVVSDNKENINVDNGSNVVVKKEEVGLGDMSIRQLKKMLKGMTISNPSNKNENEVPAARPALQPLPENR